MANSGDLKWSECEFTALKEERQVNHMGKTRQTSALRCPFCVPTHYTSSVEDLLTHKRLHHRQVRLRCFLCEFSSRGLNKWATHLRDAHPTHATCLIGLIKGFSQPASSDGLTTSQKRAEDNEWKDCQPQPSSASTESTESNQLNSHNHEQPSSGFDGGFSESSRPEPSPGELKDHVIKQELVAVQAESGCSVDKPEVQKSASILCPYCSSSCANYKELRAHCQTEHGKTSSYNCEKCNYSAAVVSKLVRHMVTHTAPNKKKTLSESPCPYCGEIYSSLPDLGRHCNEKHRTGPTHKCPTCGYETKWLYLLVRHTRIHTEEKPYSCSLCSYRVCHYTDLIRHMRMHEGEKPYACSLCSYRGAQPNHLAVHMRSHTQEKPFSCPLCFQRFAGYSGRNRHIYNATCL